MSLIFLSHSSLDSDAALEIAGWLKEQGHTSVFLDFDPELGIPAGREWEKELYGELRTCSALIALCSKNWLSSRWCFAEATHAKAMGKHIFPIKIGPCEIDSILASIQVLDLTRNPEEAYRSLRRGLQMAGIESTSSLHWDGSRKPYPGLSAFQEEDAAIFFGRDSEIREGVETLQRLRRFGGASALVLLGASGSGKSSLLRAGLLPRLRRNSDDWLVLDAIRPGATPFRELSTSLSNAFASFGDRRPATTIEARISTSDQPGSAVRSLIALIADLRTVAKRQDATVLLVIDQLEETLGLNGAGDSLLNLLHSALTADRNLLALCALRSDFLAQFQNHPTVPEFHDFPIGPIPLDRLQEVIEGPARLAGIELEPRLTNAMIADTGSEDALPLLAFALRELYEVSPDKGCLTHDNYRIQVGGIAGAVTRRADAVLDGAGLSPEQLRDLRTAFVSLAQINDEGQFVRRTAQWQELPEQVHGALERFVAARLLTSRGEGSERVLEVAHEALLRSWELLREWLIENREFLLWRRRLSQRLDEWERAGRDPAALLSDRAFTEAWIWQSRLAEQLNEAEADFILASKTALDSRRRRARAFLAVALTSLVTLTALSVLLKINADSVAEQAVRGQVLAQSESLARLPGQLRTSLWLAAHVLAEGPNLRADQLVRSRLGLVAPITEVRKISYAEVTDSRARYALARERGSIGSRDLWSRSDFLEDTRSPAFALDLDYLGGHNATLSGNGAFLLVSDPNLDSATETLEASPTSVHVVHVDSGADVYPKTLHLVPPGMDPMLSPNGRFLAVPEIGQERDSRKRRLAVFDLEADTDVVFTDDDLTPATLDFSLTNNRLAYCDGRKLVVVTLGARSTQQVLRLPGSCVRVVVGDTGRLLVAELPRSEGQQEEREALVITIGSGEIIGGWDLDRTEFVHSVEEDQEWVVTQVGSTFRFLEVPNGYHVATAESPDAGFLPSSAAVRGRELVAIGGDRLVRWSLEEDPLDLVDQVERFSLQSEIGP